MVELVARPAARAFLDVTVFVAVMIGLFAYLQLRFGDRLTDFLATRWRSGPLLGAMLGVVPGCGGAILVTPLYAQRRVSFGTVIAALVATMGDSSFVIMAADPGLALALHGVLFVVGAISGLVVDAVGLQPRMRELPVRDEPHVAGADDDDVAGAGQVLAIGERRRTAATSVTITTVPRPGDPAPRAASSRMPSWSRRARIQSTAEHWPLVFWLMTGLGAALVIPGMLQGRPPAAGASGSDIDIALVVGLVGTVTALVLAASERRARRRGPPRRPVSNLVEVLRSSAFESARIAVWVTVAFVGMEAVTSWGLPLIAMVSVAGIGGVLVGAALGLVPGCAPQIVLTGLYASGGLPFPTLLANALSQDGDALLPMLMMERRSAMVASVVTTIPGLLAGAVALAFGIGP